MELGLSGKQAIVCGASRGLGFGCAMALVAEGVDVTIAARHERGVAQAVRQARALKRGGARGAVADVTTECGRNAILRACASPDILVTNAGGPPPGDFRSWDREAWLAALDANMLSAIELIRSTIDAMLERRFGRIVNITSHMVKEPNPWLGLSNGARAGLTGFVSGLARDVAGRGVTINNILPGQFDTDRLESNHRRLAERTGSEFADVRHQMMEHIPAGRFGHPRELGALCAFVCSEPAGFMTAQNLLLDGGQYPGLF